MAHCRTEVAVNRKRMQVLYAGRVQGVGFRYAVRRLASGFEVTGAVRNLPDGRVELRNEVPRSNTRCATVPLGKRHLPRRRSGSVPALDRGRNGLFLALGEEARDGFLGLFL